MRKFFLFLLFFVISKAVFSQSDSMHFAIATESRVANMAGDPIYNGREHIGYHYAIEGIPYYQSIDWQKGRLVYQGVPYKDVFLKYDLVADELVVRHINGYSGVTLFTPRIQSFTLGNKHFVYFSGENKPTLKRGIYEELVKGKVSLYVKRSKLLTEKVVSTVIERKFVDNHTLYLMKNGNYYPVKKERDVLDLLNDKKNVRAWMKASGIKYKSDPEGALIRIVEYYNQESH